MNKLLVIEIEIDHSVEIEKDRTLDLAIGDSHKIDVHIMDVTILDRIRGCKCREYDHFANACPNAVTDDSDGCEADRAALQLITAEAEIHDNFDVMRLNEIQDYLDYLNL